jgi:hypothetical protein
MDGVIQESDPSLYERDSHAWLLTQLRLLRDGRLQDIDGEHLAELLDQMAKREVNEVTSKLVQLLLHLLKWTCQPDRQSRSWLVSIQKQQDALEDLLESKTLRKAAEARLDRAFERARRTAITETGLSPDRFPFRNPWTIDDALTWRVAQSEELPSRPPRGKRN